MFQGAQSEPPETLPSPLINAHKNLKTTTPIQILRQSPFSPDL